jgi:hypothetical protein
MVDALQSYGFSMRHARRLTVNAVPSYVKRMELAKAKRQTPEAIDRQIARAALPPYDILNPGSYGWCRDTLETHDPSLIKVLQAYFADQQAQ